MRDELAIPASASCLHAYAALRCHEGRVQGHPLVGNIDLAMRAVSDARTPAGMARRCWLLATLPDRVLDHLSSMLYVGVYGSHLSLISQVCTPTPSGPVWAMATSRSKRMTLGGRACRTRWTRTCATSW